MNSRVTTAQTQNLNGTVLQEQHPSWAGEGQSSKADNSMQVRMVYKPAAALVTAPMMNPTKEASDQLASTMANASSGTRSSCASSLPSRARSLSSEDFSRALLSSLDASSRVKGMVVPVQAGHRQERSGRAACGTAYYSRQVWLHVLM